MKNSQGGFLLTLSRVLGKFFRKSKCFRKYRERLEREGVLETGVFGGSYFRGFGT